MECFKKILGGPVTEDEFEQLLAVASICESAQMLSCDDFLSVISCAGAARKQGKKLSPVVER